MAIFPQSEPVQRGSIPEELLRPRRGEAPRHPIDTVIGALGRGQAPQEAFDLAQKAASAFLAGNITASVFSPVSKVFIESCMSQLNAINPQFYRMGSGREEPDGSVSFLVRFVGREQGIIGELFIRLEERRPAPPPPPAPPPAASETETALETEDAPETEAVLETEAALETQVALEAQPEAADGDVLTEQTDQTGQIAIAPPPPLPVQKIWLFEDLILEEARSREEENQDDRHRFDFAPYERFF